MTDSSFSIPLVPALIVGASFIVLIVALVRARMRIGQVHAEFAPQLAELRAALDSERRAAQTRDDDARRAREALEARARELEARFADADRAAVRLTAELAAAHAALADRERARDAEAAARRVIEETLAERSAQLTDMRAAHAAADERVSHANKLVADMGERMREEFQKLANSVLEEKSKSFGESQKTSLEQQLVPLKGEIERFSRALDEARKQDDRETTLLRAELQQQRDTSARLSDDAKQLTRALKGDVRAQGAWGEMVLTRLLEVAGLEHKTHYVSQMSLENEDGGRDRPDFIVKLPSGRDLVIDAKVSLVAWDRYIGAVDDAGRERELGALQTSLRQHVNGLSRKSYGANKRVNSLDFVLMFIPIEAAFVAALRHDEGLQAEAMAHGVVLISTSTLLTAVRTIEALWRIENRSRNADEIADRAGKLYDRFALFIDAFDEIGKSLNKARTAFESAHGRLSQSPGNVLWQVEQLRTLGADNKKRIDERYRKLVAGDDAIGTGEPLAIDSPQLTAPGYPASDLDQSSFSSDSSAP